MRIVLFHQFFLSQDGAGGSRWNQLSDYWTHDPAVDLGVFAGTINYLSTSLDQKSQSREQLKPNLSVTRSWTYNGYNSGILGRLWGYLSYCASALFAALVDALRRGRADVVIVTSPPLFVGFTALVYCLLIRSKLVFEVRDIWPESAITTGVVRNRTLIALMYWLEKTLYRSADLIAVLTPGFKREISSRFPDCANKIFVFTNAADFNLMQPTPEDSPSRATLRKELGWENQFVFAYFGAHGIANDLSQIIETAERLRSNQHVHFVCIGDGMQKPALVKEAQRRELSNLEFLDPVAKSRVGDFIGAADVCLAILKKSDTFKSVYPNKVFDYMCCAKPILTNIDGDIREIIESVGCGKYFDPEPASTESENSFAAQALHFYQMTSEQRAQLGQSGRKFVVENFDRKKIADQYYQAVAALGSKKRR